MKDRELDLYNILYGGCIMGLPFFFCPQGDNWRLLFLFAASFCLFEISARKKSILLYLLVWILLGASIPRMGRTLAEKACLLGGVILGGAGYFWARWKGYFNFFGGPAYPALGISAVVYVLAYMEEIEYLKGRACVFAAAVFFLCLLFRNRLEVLAYVKENEKLHRFPGKRLEKMNRRSMGVFCVILLTVMALAYFKGPEDPTLHEVKPVDLSELEIEGGPQGGMMNMEGTFLAEQKQVKPPAWLTALGDILYWSISIGLGVGFVILIVQWIYGMVFGYQNQYRKRVQEQLDMEEDVMESLAPPKFSMPKLFRKRTPTEQIRRYYKKWVLSGPGQVPGNALTPMEAEKEAKVQDGEIHDLYEKARYGKEECTAADLVRMRRKQS